MPPKSSARVLYWFRTDLRVSDSPALQKALTIPSAAFYPVFAFDPNYVLSHRVGVNRFAFLLEAMSDLDNSIRNLSKNKNQLLVVKGDPAVVMPEIWKDWGITHLVFEKDTAGYARTRDEKIKNLAANAGVEILEVVGHTLWDVEEVVEKNKGAATMTVEVWKKAALKISAVPPKPSPTPISIPPHGDLQLPPLYSSEAAKRSRVDLNAHTRTSEVSVYDFLDLHVPTLESLGLPPPTKTIMGGETVALSGWSSYISDPKQVATFSKPKSAPTDFEPVSTTLLSPYLKFGCIGVRQVWWDIQRIVEEWEKGHGSKGVTPEPENLHGQLHFREMYNCAEFATPNFDRMRGNPNCRFISWKLPNVYDGAGNLVVPRPKGSDEDEELLRRWTEGSTGFPWIDASMRQLRATGWIHHLARHSVACFLTRGQCYISWERGQEVFDEFLLDWDPASNPGNWQWLSCSAFYSMYYRVYGTASFPSKYEPTGKLVRKWCPELKDFPDKFIYEPWKAPKAVQERARCVVGVDYPEPMVNEQETKALNISRLKAAFALKYKGSSPEATDGTADVLLKKALAEQLTSAESKLDEGTSKRKASSDQGGSKGKKVKNGPMDSFVKKQ